MAKKNTKKSGYKFNFSWKTVGIISLIVNGLMIAGSISIMTLYRDGYLDTALAGTGRQRVCSDSFRSNVEKYYKDTNVSEKETSENLANLDFMCQRGDASTYYDEGLKNYKHFMGM